MPAASCPIMPARSISRGETISASFGFSFRMGRKNRDNRMGLARDSWKAGTQSKRIARQKTRPGVGKNVGKRAVFLPFQPGLPSLDDDRGCDIDFVTVG